jgi:hypothetical protein
MRRHVCVCLSVWITTKVAFADFPVAPEDFSGTIYNVPANVTLSNGFLLILDNAAANYDGSDHAMSTQDLTPVTLNVGSDNITWQTQYNIYANGPIPDPAPPGSYLDSTSHGIGFMCVYTDHDTNETGVALMWGQSAGMYNFGETPPLGPIADGFIGSPWPEIGGSESDLVSAMQGNGQTSVSNLISNLSFELSYQSTSGGIYTGADLDGFSVGHKIGSMDITDNAVPEPASFALLALASAALLLRCRR